MTNRADGPPASGLSKWTLVLGILALIIPCLTVIPAVICGHKAIWKANKNPEFYGGKGLAIAGLVAAYLSMVICIALLAGILLLPALSMGKAKQHAQRIHCVNNLRQIGIATQIYAIDNQDRFPWQVPQAEGGTAEIAQPQSDTGALLDSVGKPIFDANAWRHFQALSKELSNPKVLRCPRDESRTQANTFQSTPPKGAGRNVIPFDKNSVSYWLRTDPEVNEARPNEVMVVCPHHDGQYNILFTDSSVQQAGWNRLARSFRDITNPITIAPE